MEEERGSRKIRGRRESITVTENEVKGLKCGFRGRRRKRKKGDRERDGFWVRGTHKGDGGGSVVVQQEDPVVKRDNP